nr:cystatin-F isoform X2 [Ictidomys tridecemlineatus]
MIQQETTPYPAPKLAAHTPPQPRGRCAGRAPPQEGNPPPTRELSPLLRTAHSPTVMRPAGALLAFCCLVSSTSSGPSPDFCSQDFNSGVKPGFPKTIKTDDPGVLKAARHSVEKFNNCTNDIFLFKESYISRALVQVVKGLKYMLEVEIGRTTCRKTTHHPLDNCDFQTNPDLKRILSCYTEVWVIPWLRKFEVPIIRCQ